MEQNQEKQPNKARQPFSLKLLGVSARVTPIIYKNSLQWQYRFIYPPRRGGRNYKGVLGPVHLLTKTIIQNILIKKIQEIQAGPKPVKETLSNMIKVYMERHGKSLALEGQREKQALDHFLEYAGDRSLDDITVGLIEDFKGDRLKKAVWIDPETKQQRTLSSSTVGRDLRVLRSFFNKLMKWGLCHHNPVKEVSKPKESPGRVRYFKDKEWPVLKNELQKGPSWLYPLCVLARETGLRQGELIGLKWADVDLKENLIKVHNTKGNRIEMLPINKTVQNLLWGLSRDCEYVLFYTGKQGGKDKNLPLYRGLIDREWKKAIEGAKMADDSTFTEAFKFHDNRHDFGSRIVQAGKGIQAAMALLRHRDLRMTLRYSHLSPQYLRDAVEAIAEVSEDESLPSESSTTESVVPTLSAIKSKDENYQCPQRDSNPCYSLERVSF